MGDESEGGGKKGVEVIENCDHDCSNPVISPAKAGHSSDLETQMLSCLCLSSLLLLLFSLLPCSISLSLASLIECQGVVLALADSKFTVFTHTTGYLEFRQNKRGFSPAALELLAHLMHLNVSTVVWGQGVQEKQFFLSTLEWKRNLDVLMINM